MSTLPPLNYKYIGKFSVSTTSAQAALNTITTAFSSNTYADGTARNAGTDCAWTATTFLNASVPVAVSLAPPSSSLSQRIIYAGGSTSPSPSPTMIGSDVYSNSNNRVVFGLAKNTIDGTYVNWSNSNPYTSGSFTGYAGICNTTNLSFIHVYESQETVMTIFELNTNQVQIGLAGALLDPETTTAGNFESDGKIYGVSSSGYLAAGTVINNSYGTVGTQNFLSYGGVTAGYAKTYIFNFNSGGIINITNKSIGPSPTNNNHFKNTSGEFVRQQIFMEAGGGGLFYGRLREITTFPIGLSFTKFAISNVVNGFIIGSNSTSTSQCLLLKV